MSEMQIRNDLTGLRPAFSAVAFGWVSSAAGSSVTCCVFTALEPRMEDENKAFVLFFDQEEETASDR